MSETAPGSPVGEPKAQEIAKHIEELEVRGLKRLMVLD